MFYVIDNILCDGFSKCYWMFVRDFWYGMGVIDLVSLKLLLIYYFVCCSLMDYCNVIEFVKMVVLFNSGVSCVVLYIWFVYEFIGIDVVCVL